MPAISLIIHLDHILASSGNNTSCIKHHARNGVVVGVRIVDRPCTEVPNLSTVSIVLYMKKRIETYPDTPIRARSNEMHIVELQRSDRSCVADETAVHLSAAQIP